MKKIIAFTALAGFLAIANAHATTPSGWFITGSAAASYDIGTEPGNRHSGDNNAFIRAKAETTGFGSLMQLIDASAYRGKRVRFSGFLRTRNANKAGLWMRIDGADKHIVGFDNMDQRALHGDNDWKNYSIVLDVPQGAVDIAFGFLLIGKGEVLADDFKLETVDNSIAPTGTLHAQLPKGPVNLNFSP